MQVRVRLYQRGEHPLYYATNAEHEAASEEEKAEFAAERDRDFEATFRGGWVGEEHYGQDFAFEREGTDEEIREYAFRAFNVGDDPTFGPVDPLAVEYRKGRRRSLSVGDLVEIEGRCYLCQSYGWARVEDDALTT